MILRKYQINSTLRFYATLSALQLLCFNKNPDDGGETWNTNNTNTNETNFLQHTSENIFIDLFPEQLASLSAIIRNQNDMNMRKILEESTFQSWQSHLARKSLLEDLIRFDRNDNDRRITLYPLDIRNETKTETKTNSTTSTIQVNEAASISNDSVSLNSYFNSHSDSDRPFSLFQLPNDTRNFDSLSAYGLDERKPLASFGEFLTQDVFLDNSFYDLHLNTISSSFPSTSTSSSSSSASTSPSSSSAYGKSKRNPLKKDAVLPNINRIRRQDIDFFDRFARESNETTTFAPQLLEIKKEEPEDEEEAEAEGAAAVMREQETLAMMTTSIYKQDVDLGYTFSNYNPSYTILSPPMEEVEKVEVIQNLNDTKIADSNEHGIDIGYLLSLSTANLSGNNKTGNDSAQQKLLKIEEDRKLAEILYEQDIDLGYILSTEESKESSSSKKSSDKPVDKKIIDKEDSNDVSDLWAGIPFKIDNETGEYIRLPFEEILKDLIPMEDEDCPKDEETKVEEPTSPLDLDTTIEDIANLLTPPSEFYGVQSGQAVAPPPPPLYNSHNPNLCYQPQHGQVYPGYNENNVSVGGYYEANLGQAGASHSSNALYAASGGNQEEDLHSDAYLDSILKMMDANDTHNSTGKQSGNQIDNSNPNGSGGAKNSSKAPQNSSVCQGNVQNFLDLSCGSAGSSLGSLSSESLPSNSDGEWGDGSDHGNDFQRSNFYGPYDYSSNNSSNFTSATTAAIRQVPVAQKKYHMFGKRFLQEEKTSNNTLTDSTRINTLQSENPVRDFEGKENSTFDDEFDEEMKVHANLKNISTVIKPGVKTDPDKLKTSDEIVVRHNHTYAMSHSSDSNSALDHDGSEYGDIQSEEGHLTRDEKRARNLNIPIPVYDIINLPMDEFNERVSKYDLSENQLSLIRDIRRRGKNKVAAQNCRKRKLDTILTLETEVEKVRRRKEELHNEKVYVAMEKKRISSKFAALHKHIFHYLKDEDGKPCSPSKYSFQQSPNGSMFLAPRANSKQDPNCYGMELLMGGPSTSSACRDRSRLKDSVGANGRRTKPDEKESITEL